MNTFYVIRQNISSKKHSIFTTKNTEIEANKVADLLNNDPKNTQDTYFTSKTISEYKIYDWMVSAK